MQRLRNFFKAFDPGLIRLEQAAKGGLAIVTATIVSALAVFGLMSPPAIQPIIYGFIVAFMSFMVVNEMQPRERLRTLVLSAVLFIVAPFIIGFVRPSELMGAVILLALMFLSFYVRRFGMRAAELGLAALFGYYFSGLFGATESNAPWFALTGVIGIAAACMWIFVVKPFDPQRYLRRGVVAFNDNASDAVDAISQRIASPGTADDGATEATLKRVRASRHVIEQQLAGVGSLPGWSRERLGQLRMQLFGVEQGLESMAHSAGALVGQSDKLPADVRDTLTRSLAALSGAVASVGTPERMAALQSANADLLAQARVAQDTLGPLRPALIEFGVGGARAAQSVQGVRDLSAPPHAASAAASPTLAAQPEQSTAAAKTAAKAGQAQSAGKLHPTTVLGLQAALACGLAMIVIALLGFDRPYWAFWTAYVVVAGPTGETLRKIMYRVVGVLLGSLAGTALVLILPNNPLIILPLLVLCLVLALYTRVINYAWMCFWITTFVALIYSLEGVSPGMVLIVRPINTLIGGVIAALVVTFVFPLREGLKFRKSLASYLSAADAYLGALAGSLNTAAQPAVAVVGASALQANDAFEAVAMEYNPMSRARSPATAQATIITALHSDVGEFASLVSGGMDDVSPEQAQVIQSAQPVIHENIEALKHELGGGSVATFCSLAGQAGQANAIGDVSVQLDNGLRALAYLGRINQSVVALGNELRSSAPHVSNAQLAPGARPSA